MSKNSRQKRSILYRRHCVGKAWIALGVFDVTQQEIADYLSSEYGIEVSQPTISRDLRYIQEQIRQQTTDDLVAEFYAAHRYLIAEARRGWRLSLEQGGNPAYLSEQRHNIKAMVEIFGVAAAPPGGESEDNQADDEMDMSDEELQHRIEELNVQLGLMEGGE